jgi:hypothetical protein
MLNPSTVQVAPSIFNEDKPLLKVTHYRRFAAIIGARNLKNCTSSYLDSHEDIPSHLIPVLFPEVQMAIDHARLVNEAFAAGVIPPPISPGIGSIPIPMPEHPGPLPATASSAQQTRWRISMDTYESGEEAKFSAKALLLSMSDAEDIAAFTSLGGVHGLLHVTVPMMWDYVFGEAYANPSTDLIAKYQARVEQDFSRALSLRGNFDALKRAAVILKNANRELEYSQNRLFQIAFKICGKDQYRLRSIANDFTRLPGYNYLTATLDSFMSHVLICNGRELHAAGTGAKAFACEADYVAHSSPMNGFGFAAQEVAPAAALATVKQASPSSPQRADMVGQLCFVHGWTRTHDSVACKTMANKSSYTDAQRAVVAIPQGHPKGTPYIVDGKTCNQHCQRGVKPSP